MGELSFRMYYTVHFVGLHSIILIRFSGRSPPVLYHSIDTPFLLVDLLISGVGGAGMNLLCREANWSDLSSQTHSIHRENICPDVHLCAFCIPWG